MLPEHGNEHRHHTTIRWGNDMVSLTVTMFIAAQLNDLAQHGNSEAAIMRWAVERLYRKVKRNMEPIDGSTIESMPEGEPLDALCKHWKIRRQEVIVYALFDAWREWKGML